MSKNEFDALLLKKLQEEELEYRPASWDALARSLPPALTPASAAGKGKPWLKITGIAAAVAVILGTVFLVRLNRDTVSNPEQPVLVQQPAATPDKTPAQQQVNPPEQPEETAARAARPGTAAPQQGSPILPAYPTPVFNGHHQPANQPLPGNSPQQIANNLPVPEPMPIYEAQPVQEDKIAHNPPAVPNSVAPNAAGNHRDMAFASPFYEGRGTEQKSSKTSISLGGGVNYGNLNTGYTAGISVRRKVAGDFFVDGSVAMMYNNNANNVAANNGPSLGDVNTAARPASFNANQLASPALEPLQKLYYVQFNPSIGYQVEKHVALSVGGDFQQMLNRQEEIVQPESNNAKVFPAFDVGLTTKSEFAITPNIQAGLMYREGLNSLLKNEGSRYVNRRYVQVQFKYNIPVN